MGKISIYELYNLINIGTMSLVGDITFGGSRGMSSVFGGRGGIESSFFGKSGWC
jgi:hypothetical protein